MNTVVIRIYNEAHELQPSKIQDSLRRDSKEELSIAVKEKYISCLRI